MCALQTTKIEYINVSEYFKEILWMNNFLCEIRNVHYEYVVNCDSRNAIHEIKNLMFDSHSKYIDIHYN